MKRLVLIAALAASNANAQALDCDMYSHTRENVNVDYFEMTGRCPSGRTLLEPECEVVRGTGYGSVDRQSDRSVKCYFSAIPVEMEALGEEESGVYEGNETYDYDVQVTGLCCK